MKHIVIYCLLLLSTKTIGCPFTITNDTEHEIFITDEDMHAIHISPHEVGSIGQAITTKFMGIIPRTWFFKEKLNVYQQLENPNSFYKRFLLTEKHCSQDPKKNTFNITDIETLATSLTQRFDVMQYPMPQEPFTIPSKH